MSPMNEKENASLERGAADDIVRLRWRLQICENVVARLLLENERLRTLSTLATPSQCNVHPRLTDEEREAVERAVDALTGVEDWSADVVAKDSQAAATIRNLLARLS